jgi:hypothetical protein
MSFLHPRFGVNSVVRKGSLYLPLNSPPIATEADVSRLYRELLGRDPETPEVVRKCVSRPLLDLAIEFATSQEYRRRMQGSDFPHWERFVKAIFGLHAPGDRWLEQFRTIVATYSIPVGDIVGFFLQISEQSEGPPWPAVTEPFGIGMGQDAVTIVVPTYNSASWIAELVQAYRDIGVDPLFAVDSRTTDDTIAVLAGLEARFVTVASSVPRVEALMPAIVASASTRWILRLDDDELPSGELLRWLNGLDLDSAACMYGLSRCQLMLDGQEHLQRSRFIAFGPCGDFDRQWRLFRKDQVAFDDRLHTPGIVVRNAAPAPDAATILHFDWIIRTREARLKKFQYYRRQCDAPANKVRHIGIWEDIPLSWHRFETVQLARLCGFARKIAGKVSELD